MVTPDQKRQGARHLQDVILVGQTHPVSQRRAARVVGLHRATLRRSPQQHQKDQSLQDHMLQISHKHPRFGYRRIHALLCRAGVGVVNIKRVHRLWKASKRQVPPRQKRRARVPKDAQHPPQQALYPGHVWSYDFVHDKCHNGAKLKLLCVQDEFTRQCHAIEVGASLTAGDVQRVLHRLFATHGAPTFLRSDNGPEFVQHALRRWLADQGVQTLYIDKGAPWQNGKSESMHGKLRDECLERERFYSRLEARLVLENYRLAFNSQRPHSRLGYQTPNEVAHNWNQNHKTLT